MITPGSDRVKAELAHKRVLWYNFFELPDLLQHIPVSILLTAKIYKIYNSYIQFSIMLLINIKVIRASAVKTVRI